MSENETKESPAPETSASVRDTSGYWRDKATKAEGLLVDADKALAKMRAEHEARVKALADQHKAALDGAEKASRERLTRAELQALAIREGIHDPKYVALLDVAAAEIGPDGNIANGEALVAAFKTANPALFKGASTSSNAPVPAAAPVVGKKATEMSADEYAAAKRALLAPKR